MRKKGHVLSVTISEPNHRLKIGEKLVSNVIDSFYSNSFKKITAIIGEENEASKSLFEKLGFKIVEKISGYYEPEKSVFRYALNLTEKIDLNKH